VHVNGEAFDHVILATGATASPMDSPLYQQVAKEFGGQTSNGFPRIDEALRWVEEEDLFVVGANALLELGPGALNLMGAMRGAKIVSEQLRDVMWASTRAGSTSVMGAIATNLFGTLDIDEGGDASDQDEEGEEGGAPRPLEACAPCAANKGKGGGGKKKSAAAKRRKHHAGKRGH